MVFSPGYSNREKSMRIVLILAAILVVAQLSAGYFLGKAAERAVHKVTADKVVTG
jgi:hypothetical protein